MLTLTACLCCCLCESKNEQPKEEPHRSENIELNSSEITRQPPATNLPRTLENRASASPLPANYAAFNRPQDNASSVWTVQNSNQFLNEANVEAIRQFEAESNLRQHESPPSYWEAVDENHRV